ncbi:MAG TPA: response regulator [Anaeromyxobacteraceae bacterium]|nr:response regulator [Anaeromyxobacteraceae bacterium]
MVDETTKPKVLVVDDDEANLRAFQRVFRRQYDITAACSGEEALVELKSSRFDVALVDYAMPGMSGIDLLRQIEVLYPAVSRIMLTAHADLAEVVATTRSGLTLAAVMKPWERSDIERAVNRALSLASMAKAVAHMRAKAGHP